MFLDYISAKSSASFALHEDCLPAFNQSLTTLTTNGNQNVSNTKILSRYLQILHMNAESVYRDYLKHHMTGCAIFWKCLPFCFICCSFTAIIGAVLFGLHLFSISSVMLVMCLLQGVTNKYKAAVNVHTQMFT